MSESSDYISKRKKISLKQFDELYHKNKYCLDLQNLDLSGLDLSSYLIGKDVEYFYISNVNFENTNITILLDTNSFSGINDSNLKGVKFVTKNKMNTHFNNVTLDESATSQLNELIKYCFDDKPLFTCDRFDLYTILNNSGLKIPFDAVMLALNNWNSKYQFFEILTKEKINELERIIKIVLNSNETIRKFYDIVKDQLDYSDKVQFFFRRNLEKVTLKNVIIDKDMWHFINSLEIGECNFENVVFDFETEELNCSPNVHDTYTNNITMPKLKYSDYDKINISRMSVFPITFRKNLYLELGRSCNASCCFCRNKCMSESDYNYKKIIENLGTIINNIDLIVIGGGEPTLKKDDLMRLLRKYQYFRNKFYIFSNGTKTIDFHQSLDAYIRSNISYYISRHSVDDETNAHILGINPNYVSSIENLLDMGCNNINLSCTCVKGGTDTPDKIIDYIINYKYHNVMFCNLMDNASVNMEITYNNDINVDSSIFDEVIMYLRKQGYDYNYEIVSTAGYILYILKNKYNNDRNIIFKKYISKKELDEKWPTAIKRTFDLSMSPDGNIYESWSQLGQKVKIIYNNHGKNRNM